MPRRHNRKAHEPLRVEVVRKVVHDRGDWIERDEYERRIQAGEDKADAVLQAQEHDRINGRLDWVRCMVVGCMRDPHVPRFDSMEAKVRDSDHELPLCSHHLAVAWAMVQRNRGNSTLLRDTDALAQKRRARWEQEQAMQKEMARSGQLYAVRQNGLIKVGWSEFLESRLRSYGPSADVLCHYAGTREDETLMHRHLRPALAQGREWYHEDHPLIQDFLTKTIAQHGKATVRPMWTMPSTSSLAVQPRRRRRKR